MTQQTILIATDGTNAAKSVETATDAHAPDAIERGTGRRPTILCIDDDPDISKIIQLRLSAYGVDVQRAFKCSEGFATSLDLRPDVVITDMVMPDGEGNYVLSRIRGHARTKDTPVIILTGQRDVALKRQMLALGANAYLTKPLNFEELLEAIRPHVALSSKSNCGRPAP